MNKLSKSIRFFFLQQWACGRQLQPARISSIGWSQGILDHHFHIFFIVFIFLLSHPKARPPNISIFTFFNLSLIIFTFTFFSGRFQGFMILFIPPGKSKGPTNHHFHSLFLTGWSQILLAALASLHLHMEGTEWVSEWLMIINMSDRRGNAHLVR